VRGRRACPLVLVDFLTACGQSGSVGGELGGFAGDVEGGGALGQVVAAVPDQNCAQSPIGLCGVSGSQ